MLWARQAGWLHAKPGKDPDTRQKRFMAAGITPPLPDVGEGAYLLDAFMKMKFATTGAMGGLLPQTWTEVAAFASSTGAVTQGWEIQLLFDMSWEYVTEFNKASSPFMKSPMERPLSG